MLSKVILFPHSQNVEPPAMAALRAIEKRFGVSFSEFMSVNRSGLNQMAARNGMSTNAPIVYCC